MLSAGFSCSGDARAITGVPWAEPRTRANLRNSADARPPGTPL
jgi:hypothetical protein